MCLKWKDKRDVTMLSTVPDAGLLEVTRRTRTEESGTELIKKANMVNDYNTHMGGVDVSDQLVRYYGFPHRSVKWWKRVFYHLLDLSIVNANILYNEVADKAMTQLDFSVALARSLLEGHRPKTAQRYYTMDRESLPMRLSERPIPERIPSDTPHGGRPQCEVCGARKKGRCQTRYRCKVCQTPLHIEQCFETYHTVLHYENGPSTHTLRA